MEKSLLSAKLRAQARVLQNNISIVENGVDFEARPLGWNETGFSGMVQRAFTLRYFLFRGDEMLSEMRYDDLRDAFEISKGGNRIVMKPGRFSHNGREYQLKASMRNLEIIERSGGEKKLVGEALFGLTSYSIDFRSYPPELGDIIKEIAAMLVVKKMVWSMINPI